jgi:hypothetical protein
MHKLLLWAAAVTFSFAAFLASCAMQPQSDAQKAPAPATHKHGSQQTLALFGFAALSGNRPVENKPACISG